MSVRIQDLDLADAAEPKLLSAPSSEAAVPADAQEVPAAASGSKELSQSRRTETTAMNECS